MSKGTLDVIELARRYLSQTFELEGQGVALENLTRDAALEVLRAVPAGSTDSSPGNRETAFAGAKADRSPGVSNVEILEAKDFDALAKLVARCTRCPLHEERTRSVFGEGAIDARVVCVGEAPGAKEDETGRPFVGRAGQLLDRLLLSIGLPRETVYICNVLKSRPPRNRDPLPEEVEACSPYLIRQLSIIRPEVILAFGAFAARTLLQTKLALGHLRGRVHEYGGYPVVVTYHPAALLRNPTWVRPTWEDLQIVRSMLDGDKLRG
jgi:uracil-DNA glycosylase family 4